MRNNGYDIRTFEHASGETVAYVGFLISRELPTTEEELTQHPMVQCVNAFETIVAALMVQTIDAHVGAQVPEDQTPEDQTPEDQTPEA